MVSRRRLLIALAAAVLLAGAAGAAVWYVAGQQRSLAAVVERELGQRLGVPVRVGRASADGDRLVLRRVHIAPAPGFPLDVRAGRVEVDGGVAALVSPAGQRVSVTAREVEATVAEPPEGIAPGDAVAALAAAVRGLRDWPGPLALVVEEAALDSAAGPHAVGLRADRTDEGVSLSVRLAPRGQPAALTVTATSLPTDDAAAVALDAQVEAEPARLSALWPAAVPMPASLGGRVRLDVTAAQALAAEGTLRAALASAPAPPAASAEGPSSQAAAETRAPATTSGPAAESAPPPVEIDFQTRWDPATGELAFPRLVVARGGELRLEGLARAGRQRVWAIVRGRVDGSPITAQGTWRRDSGAVQADLSAENATGQALAQRLGLPAVDVAARRLTARLSATLVGDHPSASLDVRARGVSSDVFPSFPVDASLTATMRLAGPPNDLRALAAPAGIDVLRVAIDRDGQRVATVAAESRPGALWPLGVSARVEDLARVSPLLPLGARLRGTATLTGDLGGLEPLDLRGVLEARVTEGSALDGAVAFSRAALSLPVLVRPGTGDEPAAPAPEPSASATPAPVDGSVPAEPATAAVVTPATPAAAGTLSVDRISGWGLTVTAVNGAARLEDGRIVLSALRYTHAGGQGQGWAEIGLGPGAPAFRLGADADGVDLARLGREPGAAPARLTGRARYTASTRETGHGLDVVVRVQGDSSGGQVAADVLRRLLAASAPTEETERDRQALEGMGVFDYASLEAVVTLSGGAGWLDATLRGRRRFGFFAPTIDAIDLRRVPLGLVGRVLGALPGP